MQLTRSSNEIDLLGGQPLDDSQVPERLARYPLLADHQSISAAKYAPFHTKVINVGVRDSTYVLDGLLYNEADLTINEHYTDTNGFTDHVFGRCTSSATDSHPASETSPTPSSTPQPKSGTNS